MINSPLNVYYNFVPIQTYEGHDSAVIMLSASALLNPQSKSRYVNYIDDGGNYRTLKGYWVDGSFIIDDITRSGYIAGGVIDLSNPNALSWYWDFQGNSPGTTTANAAINAMVCCGASLLPPITIPAQNVIESGVFWIPSDRVSALGGIDIVVPCAGGTVDVSASDFFNGGIVDTSISVLSPSFEPKRDDSGVYVVTDIETEFVTSTMVRRRRDDGVYDVISHTFTPADIKTFTPTDGGSFNPAVFRGAGVLYPYKRMLASVMIYSETGVLTHGTFNGIERDWIIDHDWADLSSIDYAVFDGNPFSVPVGVVNVSSYSDDIPVELTTVSNMLRVSLYGGKFPYHQIDYDLRRKPSIGFPFFPVLTAGLLSASVVVSSLSPAVILAIMTLLRTSFDRKE